MFHISYCVVANYPIPSMYGIFTYICLIFIVNVRKYTIHGTCMGISNEETNFRRSFWWFNPLFLSSSWWSLHRSTRLLILVGRFRCWKTLIQWDSVESPLKTKKPIVCITTQIAVWKSSLACETQRGSVWSHFWGDSGTAFAHISAIGWTMMSVGPVS